MNAAKDVRVTISKRSLVTTLVACVVVFATFGVGGASTAWNIGDVFAAVGNGSYNVYDNAGNFKETISDGQGGFTTGCSFNPAGDKLYTTNFSANNVVAYNDASPHSIAQTVGTTPSANESVVFDGAGNFYVGHADGNRDVDKYDSAGTLLAPSPFDVATESRGSDWVDLAADQKTLFYTSEGDSVFRYDTATSSQLPDFATNSLPGSNAYALRILPPGDGSGGVLVADTETVVRLDGGGNVVQQYDVAGENAWFALNLDPNGTSFWSGSFDTNNFYRINISTGAVEVGPIASDGQLFGLCLKGELTAAVGEIRLDPAFDSNPVGTDHTVVATVTFNNQPAPGVLVDFEVLAGGPNAGQTSDPPECNPPGCATNAAGQVSWTYTGSGGPGVDVIQACFTDSAGARKCARAQKEWTGAGPPAHLTLDPKAAVNQVDSQHCVTATVTDANGQPNEGVKVIFEVSGSVSTTGSAVTDANGQATFCYQGPALPGSDKIHAFADTDGDGSQDVDEPSDDATKEWVAPPSTPGCKVTYGGRITAANGDKATFGGNAHATDPPKGQEEYQDHGPAADMNVHSLTVDSISCSRDGTSASIFGTATIDGAGSFQYRIDLTDLGEPGVLDTYRIRLSNGYDSGTGVLDRGNVQIHL